MKLHHSLLGLWSAPSLSKARQCPGNVPLGRVPTTRCVIAIAHCSPMTNLRQCSEGVNFYRRPGRTNPTKNKPRYWQGAHSAQSPPTCPGQTSQNPWSGATSHTSHLAAAVAQAVRSSEGAGPGALACEQSRQTWPREMQTGG